MLHLHRSGIPARPVMFTSSSQERLAGFSFAVISKLSFFVHPPVVRCVGDFGIPLGQNLLKISSGLRRQVLDELPEAPGQASREVSAVPLTTAQKTIRAVSDTPAHRCVPCVYRNRVRRYQGAAPTFRIMDISTDWAALSTMTELSQKAMAAACSPCSSDSGVYTRIGGQDFAPQTSAKWILGSTGEMAWNEPEQCEVDSGAQSPTSRHLKPKEGLDEGRIGSLGRIPWQGCFPGVTM